MLQPLSIAIMAVHIVKFHFSSTDFALNRRFAPNAAELCISHAHILVFKYAHTSRLPQVKICKLQIDLCVCVRVLYKLVLIVWVSFTLITIVIYSWIIHVIMDKIVVRTIILQFDSCPFFSLSKIRNNKVFQSNGNIFAWFFFLLNSSSKYAYKSRNRASLNYHWKIFRFCSFCHDEEAQNSIPDAKYLLILNTSGYKNVPWQMWKLVKEKTKSETNMHVSHSSFHLWNGNIWQTMVGILSVSKITNEKRELHKIFEGKTKQKGINMAKWAFKETRAQKSLRKIVEISIWSNGMTLIEFVQAYTAFARSHKHSNN